MWVPSSWHPVDPAGMATPSHPALLRCRAHPAGHAAPASAARPAPGGTNNSNSDYSHHLLTLTLCPALLQAIYIYYKLI